MRILAQARWARLAALAATAVLVGCSSQREREIEPRHGPVKKVLPAEAEVRAEKVRRDPLAYLHVVADNCGALRQYTLLFVRYERRGLFQQLYGPEHIRCWFRRQPFSIKMNWLDTSLKYYESAYIQGENNNKVLFITRWWVPPLVPPPGINKVDLQTPVTWGESKRPLTDFGLERLMERTLTSLEQAGEDVVVTYQGLMSLAETDTTVHHLHLAYPESQFRVPIQELYVDVQTDLPVGTVLKYASGRIDAAYFYERIDTHVKLTNADFKLNTETLPPRAPAEPEATTSQPAD